jgi:DNA-binding XRE family transcriptional regulator
MKKMAKASFPYKVVNNLDKYVRLKQAEMMEERGDKVTLQEVYEAAGNYCGVKPYTVSMIKSGSYNPSVILAFLLAEFFGTTVDELFGIVPEGEKTVN